MKNEFICKLRWSERIWHVFLHLLFALGCEHSTHKTISNLSEKPIFYATLYAYMSRNKKFIKKKNSCTTYGIISRTQSHKSKKRDSIANDKMLLNENEKKERKKFSRFDTEKFINYFPSKPHSFSLMYLISQVKLKLFIFAWKQKEKIGARERERELGKVL